MPMFLALQKLASSKSQQEELGEVGEDQSLAFFDVDSMLNDEG